MSGKQFLDFKGDAFISTIFYHKTLHAMLEHSHFTRCGLHVNGGSRYRMGWNGAARRGPTTVTCERCKRSLAAKTEMATDLGALARAVDEVGRLRHGRKWSPVSEAALKVFDDGLNRIQLAVSSLIGGDA